MINKILVISICTLLTLIIVLVLGRGGMEPEMAIIPVLNTPALLLRALIPFWAIPLVLMIIYAVIIKNIKKDTARNTNRSVKL